VSTITADPTPVPMKASFVIPDLIRKAARNTP
jgi:hypothetical protein